MKKYKAIVVDGKKLIRFTAVTLVLILLILISFPFFHNSFSLSLFQPQTVLQSSFPAAGAANQGIERMASSLQANWRQAILHFLGFDPQNPNTLLATEVPCIQQTHNSALVALTATETPEAPTPIPTTTPAPTANINIPEEHQAPIKAVNLSPDKSNSGKLVLSNETSYSIDINEMLQSPLSLNMQGSGPKVLVIHTHATESYAPEGSLVYDTTLGDRSQNPQETVVRVGETLCNIFRQKGIEVIHDTQLHDYPSFNGSYASSLLAMESYLKQHPSIQVIFDIHRDSIVYSDNTKAKPLTQINGKDAAQLMFVVGTDEKGLHHPNWRENLKAAIHFQNAINQKYPTLMRHINLRQERFNGHTSKASMIIETGASGNSLSEAEYGLSLAAECIADYLNEI